MISVKKALVALAFTFSLGSPSYAWTSDVVDQIQDALDDPDCVSLIDWNDTVHILDIDGPNPASNNGDAAAILRDVRSALVDAKGFDVTVGGKVSSAGIDEVGRIVDANVIADELRATSQAAATVWLGRRVPGQYGDELSVALLLRDILREELTLTCIISFNVIVRHQGENDPNWYSLFDPARSLPFRRSQWVEQTPTRRPEHGSSGFVATAEAVQHRDNGFVGAQRYAQEYLADLAFAVQVEHADEIKSVSGSGFVSISFDFDFNDQSVDVRVSESSGNHALDDAVLSAAKSAASARWQFPPSQGGWSTEVMFSKP